MSLISPKKPAEIEAMRQGGKILAEALLWLKEEKVVPGMTTADIDQYTREFFQRKKVTPAFLGYAGFGGAICVSVNQAVIHGLPNRNTVIQEGDLVSLDCGVKYQNMIVDSALSFGVGKIADEYRLLIERTEKSLYKGIKMVKDKAYTGDIGYAIEQYINQFGYGIVRDYAGHGVGYQVHEEPNIPNYGRQGSGSQLQAGMTIAIEPMITLGAEEVFTDTEDDWTVYTEDGSYAAHFEHTVLVGKYGPEILTQI